MITTSSSTQLQYFTLSLNKSFFYRFIVRAHICLSFFQHFNCSLTPVFFNLFSEAELFAAILIAHGTHVFLGGLLRPEGPKFEVEGRERGGVLGERAASPLPTAKGLGSAVSSPSVVRGGALTANIFWIY